MLTTSNSKKSSLKAVFMSEQETDPLLRAGEGWVGWSERSSLMVTLK